MSLTLDAIGTAVRDAIRDSEAILAACLDYYDRAHAVHYGSSGIRSARPEDYPVFTVIGWEKERGDEETRRLYILTVGLDLHDEEMEEDISPQGVKTITYRGAQTLETLLDLGATAIRDISPNLFWDVINFVFEPIEFFPVFAGELNLTAGFDIVIGGAEPSL